MESTPKARLAVTAILLIVGVLGATGVASAQDSVIYVDSGSDDPNCAGNDYTDIQSAVNNAAAGDTVIVCSGFYYGEVTIDKPLSIEVPSDSTAVLYGGTLGSGSTAVTIEPTAGGTTIEGLEVMEYGTALDISANDTVVSGLLANNSDVGVMISVSGSEAVSNVTLRNSTLDSMTTGVAVESDDSGRVTDVTLFRNIIHASDVGVRIDESSSSPLANIDIRQNLVVDSPTAGVSVTSGTDATGIQVTRNFLRDNGIGVDNNGVGTLTAWLNHWGGDSGPSSVSGTVVDPNTGAPADGNGDSVSADVHFDPWLGKGACTDSQLRNVTERTLTIGWSNPYQGSSLNIPPNQEVQLSQLQPTCLWERAGLPLRADDAGAATSVRNLQLFGRSGSGDVPANRPRLSVYQQGNDLTLQFESTSGADVSQFKREDTQLLVVRDSGVNTDFEVGLDNSTGEGTFTLDDASVSVRDTPTLDADGELNHTFTPDSAGSYTFILVTNDFGPGVEADGSGEIRIDGGVTIIGVESVPVQNENASANPTATSFTAGSNVTFDLDSNLQDRGTNHTVLLYNEMRFVNSQMFIAADGDLSDVLTGDVSSTDVTAEHSIRSINGFIRADVGVSALGYEVAAQDRSGRIDPSPLADSAANQFGFGNQVTTSTTSDATLLNGSVVVAQSSGSTSTVDVETFQNFSAGTYQWVYIAEQDSAVSSDAGTVQLTTPTPTPGGGGGGGGGDGDGGGGGGGGGLPGGGGADGTVEIQSTELLNGTVAADQDTVVRVELANRDPIRGRITLELTTDGETVAEERVTVAASSERTVYVRAGFDTPGTYNLALNGIDLGTVTVTERAAETPTQTPDGGLTPPPTDTPEVTDTADQTPTDVSPTPPSEPAGPTGTEIALAFGLLIGLIATVGVVVYVLSGRVT